MTGRDRNKASLADLEMRIQRARTRKRPVGNDVASRSRTLRSQLCSSLDSAREFARIEMRADAFYRRIISPIIVNNE